MPSQKIHESLVIGIRKPEQRQHLPIASARPLQSMPYETFHMCPGHQPLRERLCNRVPEISDDEVLEIRSVYGFGGQRDVVGVNDWSHRNTDSSFDNVLQLADVSWKRIRHQLCHGIAGDLLSSTQKMIDEERNIVDAPAQRRNMDWKDIEPVVQVFPEVTSPDHAAQFTVGCGNDANIELAHGDVSEPADLLVL